MDELYKMLQRQIVSQFRDLGDYVIQLKEDQDIIDQSPLIKNLTHQELDETKIFINEFSDFVEKWQDKQPIVVKPILKIFTDIMQGFLIGPDCVRTMGMETSKFLMMYMLLSEKRRVKKQEHHEEVAPSIDENLTGLKDSEGNPISFEQLEREMENK